MQEGRVARCELAFSAVLVGGHSYGVVRLAVILGCGIWGVLLVLVVVMDSGQPGYRMGVEDRVERWLIWLKVYVILWWVGYSLPDCYSRQDS